jgi:hypothetical protein
VTHHYMERSSWQNWQASIIDFRILEKIDSLCPEPFDTASLAYCAYKAPMIDNRDMCMVMATLKCLPLQKDRKDCFTVMSRSYAHPKAPEVSNHAPTPVLLLTSRHAVQGLCARKRLAVVHHVGAGPQRHDSVHQCCSCRSPRHDSYQGESVRDVRCRSVGAHVLLALRSSIWPSETPSRTSSRCAHGWSTGTPKTSARQLRRRHPSTAGRPHAAPDCFPVCSVDSGHCVQHWPWTPHSPVFDLSGRFVWRNMDVADLWCGATAADHQRGTSDSDAPLCVRENPHFARLVVTGAQYVRPTIIAPHQLPHMHVHTHTHTFTHAHPNHVVW